MNNFYDFFSSSRLRAEAGVFEPFVTFLVAASFAFTSENFIPTKKPTR